jgi:uncharacterized protein (TIGR00369 family)
MQLTIEEKDMNAVTFAQAVDSVAIDADEILDDLLYPAGHAVVDGGAKARPSGATRRRVLEWDDPVVAANAGAELTGLDYMRALELGEIPPPPMAITLNMRPVEVEHGRAVFEGHPGEEHYNPIGVVHGGYAATLLDSAIGCAVHTTLPAGVAYTTLTLETKFVRAITRNTGPVRAEAWVAHRGRRQATAEGRLTAVETGKLLAHATGTCMILGEA